MPLATNKPQPQLHITIFTHRWHLIKRGCLLGALVSGGLSVATLLSRNSVLRGLTSDAAVQAACLSIFPMVMACQVNKGACVLVRALSGIRGGGKGHVHIHTR